MVKCKILDERLWVKTQENKTEGSELSIKIALFFSYDICFNEAIQF